MLLVTLQLANGNKGGTIWQHSNIMMEQNTIE